MGGLTGWPFLLTKRRTNLVKYDISRYRGKGTKMKFCSLFLYFFRVLVSGRVKQVIFCRVQLAVVTLKQKVYLEIEMHGMNLLTKIKLLAKKSWLKIWGAADWIAFHVVYAISPSTFLSSYIEISYSFFLCHCMSFPSSVSQSSLTP
jgi:hypothetical protein